MQPTRGSFSIPVWTTIRTGLACLLVLLQVMGPEARAQAPDVSVRAAQAVLMDAESGGIMYSKQGDALVPPASMSKLMLLAVVFKALRTGEIKAGQVLTMSADAARRGKFSAAASTMQVAAGAKVPIEDLVKGIVVQSGNDAAICVAETLSGSEALFARRMTEEARALGLARSQFRNATGVHEPEQVMTMRELALLARHIIRTYPEEYRLFALKEYTYRKTKFTNRNPLLGLVPGADGLKTGFVKESGYGLVASVVQDGRRLIVVVNGASSAEERREDARRLIEWGFRAFAPARLYEGNAIVGEARVWGADRMRVPLMAGADIAMMLPKAQTNPKLTARIHYAGPLKPPLKRGDQVAVLRVAGPQETALEAPLYVAENVESGRLWWRGLDSLLHLVTRWMR